MKITVIGTGYVGLVSGACFADVGTHVTCVDIDQSKIDNLKKGILPIYEPGLDDIVLRNYAAGRLHFTTDLSEALRDSHIVFIAVGTPSDEDGSADLSHVLNVARAIGETMDHTMVITTKSTVPVTTGAKVKQAIADALNARNETIPFSVASNPEFLKEGAAIADFMKPDRVVIGTDDDHAAELLAQLYAPFSLGDRLIRMDILSAEMTKYAANAMLATRISFMNDIANLCDRVGANVHMVRMGIGTDTRIGPHFLNSGIGYGGSCFPKDIKALLHTGHLYDYDMRIIQAVEDINQDQKHILIEKIKYHFNNDLNGKHFALWGLSFKPNTDDIRQSPALVLIDALLNAGATISAYDPVAMGEMKHVYDASRIRYTDDPAAACDQADGIILVTEWSEFRTMDWSDVAARMKTKCVFDGRNIYDRAALEKMGFTYYGIGT